MIMSGAQSRAGQPSRTMPTPCGQHPLGRFDKLQQQLRHDVSAGDKTVRSIDDVVDRAIVRHSE